MADILGKNTIANIPVISGGRVQKRHVSPVGDATTVDLGNDVVVPAAQGLSLMQARRETSFPCLQGNSLSSVFSSGSTIEYDVLPGGLGKLDNIILELNLTMTASTATIAPSPLLIDYFEIFPKQGSKAIGKFYGQQLYYALVGISPEQMRNLKDVIGENEKFMGQMTLSTTTKKVHIPIGLGNWISQGETFVGADFNAPLRFKFKMASNAVESGTAANITITSSSLKLHYIAPDTSRENPWKARINRGFTQLWTGVDYQLISNQTLTAGTTTKFQLNSIIGKCHFLLVAVQGVSASSTSPNRGGLRMEYPIDSMDLQTNSNQSLIAPYALSYDENKAWYWSRFFANGNFFAIKHNLFIIPFGEDPGSTLARGVNTGHFYMTGKELLAVTPSSTATVATVLAIKTVNSGTNDVLAATEGTFRIGWADPKWPEEWAWTSDLAFDAAVGTVQSAIYALPTWDPRATFTLNEALSADGEVTITFGGQYLFDVPTYANIQFSSQLSNNTIGIRIVENSGGTAGVKGFTTGSYDIKVWAWMAHNHKSYVGQGGNLFYDVTEE